MTKVDPAIHVFLAEVRQSKTWMPGTSPGMTQYLFEIALYRRAACG
jgi:hypothetical protein